MAIFGELEVNIIKSMNGLKIVSETAKQNSTSDYRKSNKIEQQN